MSEGNYEVKASVPPGGWGFSFGSNHFYFEIKDPNDNVLRVNAAELFIGYCKQCERKVIVAERTPDAGCPYCLTRSVEWWDGKWLGFIPSSPSDFKAPPQRKRLSEAGAFSDAIEGELTPPPGKSSDR